VSDIYRKRDALTVCLLASKGNQASRVSTFEGIPGNPQKGR